MTLRLVLLGGGAHLGTVHTVIDAVNAVTPRLEVVGVLDDGRPDPTVLGHWGLAHLGPIAALERLDVDAWFPSVGLSATRRAVCASVNSRRPAAVIVSPTSVIAPGSTLGPGTLAAPTISVAAGTVVGEHVLLGRFCAIGPGVRIGRYATILVHAVVGAGVTIGEGVVVGTGALVAPGVTVGPWATLGTGAVVTDDVPPGTLVVGNPARPRPAADGTAP